MEEKKFKKSFKIEWNNFSFICWNLLEKYFENFTKDEITQFKNSIKNATNTRKRIQLVFNHKLIYNYLEQQAIYFTKKINNSSCKDIFFSKECKIKGDDYLKKQNYNMSLKYYSKAILFFDEFSFDNDSNSLTLNELFLLRGKTFEKLEKFSIGKFDFIEALKLNKTCLDTQLKKKILINNPKKNFFDLKSNFFNPNLEGATSAVSMSYSKNKGRLIIANRDIEEGEIIFKEEPYVHWLRPSLYKLYCNHCLIKLTKYQFIPCSICINVRYCSSDCKEIAWKRYHKIECKYLDLLKNWSSAHMALRLMLRDGLDYVFEEDNKKPIILEDWPKKGFKADYSYIKSLIGEDSFINSDNYCYSIIGCIMISIFFTESKLIDKKNIEQFASILLKSLMQILENTFLIYDYDFELVDKNYSFIDSNKQQLFKISSNSVKLGVGLYSCASLIAHSCDNNSHKYYFNNFILIVSAKKIPAFTEVNIEYGVHYKMNSLKDRKLYLKNNFVFDCKCNACECRYENIGLALKCTKCENGPLIYNSDQTNYCLNCNVENVNLSKIVNLLNKGEVHFKNGVEQFELKKLIRTEIELKICEDIFSKVYHGNIKLQLVKSKLSQLYYSKKNYYLAYKYLLETLPFNNDLYNENSFESLCCLIDLTCLVFEKIKYSSKKNKFLTFQKHLKNFLPRLQIKEFILKKIKMQQDNNDKFNKNSYECLNKYDLKKWQNIFNIHFTSVIDLLNKLFLRQINIVSEESIFCLDRLEYLQTRLI